jgi:hypothetical protein
MRHQAANEDYGALLKSAASNTGEKASSNTFGRGAVLPLRSRDSELSAFTVFAIASAVLTSGKPLSTSQTCAKKWEPGGIPVTILSNFQ